MELVQGCGGLLHGVVCDAPGFRCAFVRLVQNSFAIPSACGSRPLSGRLALRWMGDGLSAIQVHSPGVRGRLLRFGPCVGLSTSPFAPLEPIHKGSSPNRQGQLRRSKQTASTMTRSLSSFGSFATGALSRHAVQRGAVGFGAGNRSRLALVASLAHSAPAPTERLHSQNRRRANLKGVDAPTSVPNPPRCKAQFQRALLEHGSAIASSQARAARPERKARSGGLAA